MNDQIKQDLESQPQHIDDDPLAELARIVAGEPEVHSKPQEMQAEEINLQDATVEAALEEQLMQEFAVDDAETEVEAPAFVDDINASIEEITNVEAVDVMPQNEEIALEASIQEQMAQEMVMPEPEAQNLSQENTVSQEVGEPVQTEASMEAGFQDSLISALEFEISAEPKPEHIPEQAVEAEASFIEPEAVQQENVVQENVVAGIAEPTIEEAPFGDALVNELEQALTGDMPVEVDAASEVELNVENMQQALEQELSQQLETNPAFVEEPAIIEQQVLEQPKLDAGVDTAASSLEEDLGNAFASEFEQLSAQQPDAMQEQAVQPATEPLIEDSTFEQAIASELQNETVAVASDPALEMDFEAAFSKELETIAPPEAGGWAETETAEANAAFTAAVQPETAMSESQGIADTIDELDFDPGHVGDIDEIITEDTDVVAANDNGGGKKYAVAALVIALFAGAIAAGYGFLGGENTTVASGTPEIIKADATPVKVKPEDPGGIVPENQDNASYGDLGGENNTEVSQQTLTSETEEPLILNTGNTEAPKSDDRLASSEDAGATPTATSNSAVQPKVVQTVVVKPDGTIIRKPVAATPKAPEPIETALNSTTIGDVSDVAVKPVTTQVIKKPESIDGAQSTGNLSIPEASPLPKPVIKPKPAAPVERVAAAPAPAPKPTAPAQTRKSEWVVQVSSQRTPEAAQSSFANMRNRFSALQGRAMSIQRANVNGTTYYRVRVQTASRSDATDLCSRLASAGGNCFVTR